MANQTTLQRVIEADKNARVFLIPPHDHKIDREGALEIASEHIRAAIEQLVRANRTDLAFKALHLAQETEAARK